MFSTVQISDWYGENTLTIHSRKQLQKEKHYQCNSSFFASFQSLHYFSRAFPKLDNTTFPQWLPVPYICIATNYAQVINANIDIKLLSDLLSAIYCHDTNDICTRKKI